MVSHFDFVCVCRGRKIRLEAFSEVSYAPEQNKHGKKEEQDGGDAEDNKKLSQNHIINSF